MRAVPVQKILLLSRCLRFQFRCFAAIDSPRKRFVRMALQCFVETFERPRAEQFAWHLLERRVFRRLIEKFEFVGIDSSSRAPNLQCLVCHVSQE